MRKTLKEIAALVKGEVVGDDQVVISGISGIKEAREGDLTFLANPKYYAYIEKTQASAIITPRDIERSTKPIIRTDNPTLAFSTILGFFMPQESGFPQVIHPTAIIGKSVSLGKNVGIGPYAVIEDDVSLGDETVIGPGCFIGQHTQIGKKCIIYSHVSIRERSVVGNSVIIHCGTVIGSDGFGFATIDGVHHKIPQVGMVEIGDDVEIGANVTIDRARFDKTIIGKGTKIDNLVQIAHNVVTGENCIIVAQAGVSGSTILGKNVTLAGQAGLVGHITIGDGATVAAQGGVTKSVPANTLVSGYPAKPHDVAKRINAYVQNLPRLAANITELKKRIEKLEAQLESKQNG
jgi:UDP-3-O-[3-hydroxymyristoyl] glucosamine N-acyltransferase